MPTVSSAWCISMLSVSSSSSSAGARPVSPSTRSIMPIRSFCRNWRADRLTAIRNPGMPRLPRLRLRARLAQHPFAERNDQARVLGDRDELRRRHQPLVRLRPAQQRFGAADAPRGEVDQRLVVQHELAVLERAPQVGLGREAAAHALGHLRAEELVVGAARLLGVIHRGVGVAHQRLGGVAVGRVERDADAAVGVQLVPGDRERLRELAQGCGRPRGRLRRRRRRPEG